MEVAVIVLLEVSCKNFLRVFVYRESFNEVCNYNCIACLGFFLFFFSFLLLFGFVLIFLGFDFDNLWLVG